jgi:hypothetical protein
MSIRDKPVAFPLLSNREIDDKMYDYLHSAATDLDNDVGFLTGSENRKHIERLFKSPESFENGEEVKLKVLNLIEVYYLIAVKNSDVKAQDALSDLIYGFYTAINSMILEESLVFSFEKDGKTDIDDKKYEMLEFFYRKNTISFRNAFHDVLNDAHIAYRVNNQKRIMRLFLSCGRKARIEEIGEKLSSDILEVLYLETYLDTFLSIPEQYLHKRLTQQQLRDLGEVLQSARNIRYLFDDISLFGIPAQISRMYVKIYKDETILQGMLSVDLPVENRLHALLRLATIEENPFSVEASFSRIIDTLGGVKEEKTVISADVESELAKEGLRLLEAFAEDGFSATNDSYANAVDAEMLFTAAAVVLHEKYPETDLIDFLSQLKFTFVRDNHTEFIVNYSGGDESEYVRIAMNGNKDYIDSIKDFVESIYRINTGRRADGSNAKFKSVAKGRSALIKIVRRTRSAP